MSWVNGDHFADLGKMVAQQCLAHAVAAVAAGDCVSLALAFPLRYARYMTTLTVTVLDAADPKAAVKAIDAAAPGLRRRLSASLRDALRGRPAATRRYVAAHRELTERLLAAMHEARPDLVVRDDAGEYCVAHPGGCSRTGIELLRTFAADAPFSPWVQLKGPGTGVALDLLARARALLPGVEPWRCRPAPPSRVSTTRMLCCASRVWSLRRSRPSSQTSSASAPSSA